jgi:hypothetical protein
MAPFLSEVPIHQFSVIDTQDRFRIGFAAPVIPSSANSRFALPKMRTTAYLSGEIRRGRRLKVEMPAG